MGDPRDATGLYAAMRRYLAHRATIGSTEQGLYGTERYLRDFIAWAHERAITHPQHVSRPVLERYQRWLHHYRKRDGAPLSVASQRGKLVPLRGWFKWLTRTGEIPANPAADLDLPRRIRRLPRSVLTAGEVERVLALADTGTPLGLRDRALMELLYATGMRRMEVAQLELGDIDAERCVVLIREGKGRRDRLLPLGERALYWVQQYLDGARPQLAWNLTEPTLLLSNEGNPMNAVWLSTVVAQYVERAELGKHGGCHLFRHTMATLMLENGADIRFIQAMLGHAELSTTQIYTQVAIRQLQQVHAATHPGAKRRAPPVGGDATAQAREVLLEALDEEDDD
ncbi:site-specific tyrosine recombinase XerC [Cupriavidus sp. 30B13]|uniref:site-specific tyrosine recombinase XerC n=1 Tax=Cupriavidus sp. 30B13 TaxID=3384241 RepID=UPI003B90F66F